MQTVRVLLVDSKDTVKNLLEHELLNAEMMKFVVTLWSVREARKNIHHVQRDYDVVFFGEKLALSSVTELTRALRGKNVKIPLIVLTKQSEAKPSKDLEHAGVDDLLNVAEMRTPLFAWTFQSLLEQVEMRKKAKDYDVLRNRLKHIDESLGDLMHKINNPLSVVRLTLYHLEKPDLSKDKREVFIKLMIDSVKKIDAHINELRSIHRQLGEDTTIITKILAMKAVRQVIASN